MDRSVAPTGGAREIEAITPISDMDAATLASSWPSSLVKLTGDGGFVRTPHGVRPKSFSGVIKYPIVMPASGGGENRQSTWLPLAEMSVEGIAFGVLSVDGAPPGAHAGEVVVLDAPARLRPDSSGPSTIVIIHVSSRSQSGRSLIATVVYHTSVRCICIRLYVW